MALGPIYTLSQSVVGFEVSNTDQYVSYNTVNSVPKLVMVLVLISLIIITTALPIIVVESSS